MVIESGSCQLLKSFGLFDYCLFKSGCSPVGIIIQRNDYHIFVPMLVGSSLSSSLNVLSLILKSFSFQPPDQLVKPFTTAHVYSYLGHFYFNIVLE